MGYVSGHKWTNEEIIYLISKMVDKLELERMPTRKEVVEYYNDAAASAITRRFGWYNLAETLNLPIKKCDTTTGKNNEALLAKELSNMGFKIERMPQNFPYDLLIDNAVKIDVKASHVYHGKKGAFYSFHIEKPHPTCDIYVLRLLDDDDNIVQSLIVPSKEAANNKHISVGAISSKYDRYAGRWDIIKRYSDFMRGV